VGLSCYALVRVTQFMFDIPSDKPMALFAFFGTFVGYNFVKYDALARTKKLQMRNQLKTISFLSLLSLFAIGYFFFQLRLITQIMSTLFLGLIVLYTLPFFPNRRNARNWAGVKIYMVALCWVGVTVVLPIMNTGISITSDFYLKCIQRFILIFTLILIFEIIDLQVDDPHLKTVPQQIGLKQTKQLGYLLLFAHCCLEIFNRNFNVQFFILQLTLIFVITIFLFFANEKSSKYYTSFWVESVPIFSWILLFYLKK